VCVCLCAHEDIGYTTTMTITLRAGRLAEAATRSGVRATTSARCRPRNVRARARVQIFTSSLGTIHLSCGRCVHLLLLLLLPSFLVFYPSPLRPSSARYSSRLPGQVLARARTRRYFVKKNPRRVNFVSRIYMSVITSLTRHIHLYTVPDTDDSRARHYTYASSPSSYTHTHTHVRVHFEPEGLSAIVTPNP